MQVVSGIWQTLIQERSKGCVKFKATVGSSLTVVKEKKYSLEDKEALVVPGTIISDPGIFSPATSWLCF